MKVYVKSYFIVGGYIVSKEVFGRSLEYKNEHLIYQTG